MMIKNTETSNVGTKNSSKYDWEIYGNPWSDPVQNVKSISILVKPETMSSIPLQGIHDRIWLSQISDDTDNTYDI